MNSGADRLTATRKSGGSSGSHRAMRPHTVSRLHRPSSCTKPDSSATGMKSVGEVASVPPRTHRISASAPTILPSASTCAW